MKGIYTTSDANKLFWDYCFEEDDEKAFDIVDELIDGIVSLHCITCENGDEIIEHLSTSVEFCCERFHTAWHERTLIVNAIKKEQHGNQSWWYFKCPFCDTKLVGSVDWIMKEEKLLER